jgi:hypothetical protein
MLSSSVPHRAAGVVSLSAMVGAVPREGAPVAQLGFGNDARARGELARKLARPSNLTGSSWAVGALKKEEKLKEMFSFSKNANKV